MQVSHLLNKVSINVFALFCFFVRPLSRKAMQATVVGSLWAAALSGLSLASSHAAADEPLSGGCVDLD